MQILPYKHLLTLSLDVGFGEITSIGSTPAGVRKIAPVKGGNFAGDRLNGIVAGGSDWFINRPDAVMTIDVRLALRTNDGAAIYLSYNGRFLAAADVMSRFARGAQLDPSTYSLAMSARFECGADRYAWLNNVIAVGIGRQTPTGAVYEIFEIG